MTITNPTRLVRYIGNSATTLFPFDFLIPEDTLVVSLYSFDLGTLTELSEGVDYSVTGLDDPDGGSVTYPLSGSAMTSSSALVIKRDVPYTQETTISNQGGFHPDVIEEQLDLIVMQIQQLAEQSDRSLRFVEGADVDPESLVLPEPEDDTVLGWIDGALTNIAPGSATLQSPADNSVSTASIQNNAVTADKISLADIAAITTKLTASTLSGTETLQNKSLRDSSTRFRNQTDTTKVLMFSLAAISAATTRTIAWQDANGTVALLNVEGQALSGGANVTSKDLGTKSSGTLTIDVSDCPLQHVTNNGAHTWALEASMKGNCLVEVTNGASAGAINTAAFTYVTGAFTTTNAHKFLCSITVSQTYSFLAIQALQ